jgi:sporulation protein YlmC with PRC-barrel domain
VPKTTMMTAFAATLALAMPVALAQTATTPPRPMGAEAHANVTTNHIMPGQIRVTQMDGATVHDAKNQNIGDVKDIILDRDGRVAAVILDVGSFLGMGGKFVAIPMNDMKVAFDKDNNKPRFTVDMTKEQLKAAQAFDLNEKKATTGTSTPPANRER